MYARIVKIKHLVNVKELLWIFHQNKQQALEKQTILVNVSGYSQLDTFGFIF
jgi:ABC-type transporter Mla MlaB component